MIQTVPAHNLQSDLLVVHDRPPHPTAEGIGHAIAHPVATAKAAGHAIKEIAKGIAAGDARSGGLAVGTIGMAFIPGAEEAEGAEALARLSPLP